MNRKGFLLAEETLKIILAVIAIGFLVYLLFSLYQSGKDSKDLEFAEESLSFLVQELNSQSVSIEIYNPKNWNLMSFSGSNVPRSCSNIGWSSCICICEKSNPDSCDEEGVCVNNEDQFAVNEGSIKFSELPITLNVNYEGKLISKS